MDGIDEGGVGSAESIDGGTPVWSESDGGDNFVGFDKCGYTGLEQEKAISDFW